MLYTISQKLSLLSGYQAAHLASKQTLISDICSIIVRVRTRAYVAAKLYLEDTHPWPQMVPYIS